MSRGCAIPQQRNVGKSAGNSDEVRRGRKTDSGPRKRRGHSQEKGTSQIRTGIQETAGIIHTTLPMRTVDNIREELCNGHIGQNQWQLMTFGMTLSD